MKDKPFIIDLGVEIYAANEPAARREADRLINSLFEDERVGRIEAYLREGELEESS